MIEIPPTGRRPDRQGGYEHKIVRDLAYAVGLSSAALLWQGAASVGGGAAAGADTGQKQWRRMVELSESWVAELDREPEPLQNFLSTVSGLGRVQNYHAALVQFWLAHASTLVAAAPPTDGARDRSLEGGLGDSCRKTVAPLPVGCARLTAELRFLAGFPASAPGGGGTLLHVEPSIVFAIDASTLCGQQCAGNSSVPAGRLVSFDLDSNLQYRIQVSRRKMHISQSPQVQQWAATKLCDAAHVASHTSMGRITGSVFRPLEQLSEPNLLGRASGESFWTEDVDALVAARPTSRWAIVDWRHFLAPARVTSVAYSELHFSRDISGKPFVVPSVANFSPDEALTAPSPPLCTAERSRDVEALQFLLIQCGYLRPSAIRFHSGIYGRHTLAAVSALQAVYGLPPTGLYNTLTAEALQHCILCARKHHSASREAVKSGPCLPYDLPHDVVGTALFPSDIYQRMSDASKTQEQKRSTNGSVMEIGGTDVDGAGGEQRFRIWVDEKGKQPAVEPQQRAEPQLREPSSELEPELEPEPGPQPQPGLAEVTDTSEAEIPILCDVSYPEQLLVVEGSLATLIPHEPIITGPELISRVKAMQGTAAPVSLASEAGTAHLLDARSAMLEFARSSWARGLCHPWSWAPKADEDKPVGKDAAAATAAAAATLWLPAELTEAQRSVLHREAEGLGLGHVSVGEGRRRRLLLWKGPAPRGSHWKVVALAADEAAEAKSQSTNAYACRGLPVYGMKRLHASVSAEPVNTLYGTYRTDQQLADGSKKVPTAAAEEDILSRLPQVLRETLWSREREEGEKDVVGPTHEALRVPAGSVNGGIQREIVANPAALIEIVQNENGDLFERSRGFILPTAWRVAAATLVSVDDDSPLANPHRSRQLKDFNGPIGHNFLTAFDQANPDGWAVMETSLAGHMSKNSSVRQKKASKCFAPLDLPAEVTGATLMESVARWMSNFKLADTDSAMHSPNARACIAAEWTRLSAEDGMALLVDMLRHVAGNEGGIARAYAVLGALGWDANKAGQKLLASATKDAGGAVRYGGRHVIVGGAMDAVIQLICEAFEPSVAALERGDRDRPAASSKLCGLFLKALTIVASDRVHTSGAVVSSACVTRALALGRRAVSSALQLLTENDCSWTSEAKPGSDSSSHSSSAIIGSLSVAVELLHSVGARWGASQVSLAEGTELIHWLVLQSEHTCAALVVGNQLQLQVALVEAILGCGGVKKAAKFVVDFNLQSKFPAVDVLGKRGKQNKRPLTVVALPVLQKPSSARCYTVPNDVVTHYIVTPAELTECTQELLKRGGVCAVDAEWEPFSADQKEPSPVSLLQIAIPAGKIWLLDMLALASADTTGGRLALEQFWRIFTSSELVVVGFGLAGDLGRLCSSYPTLLRSRCCHRALELQHILEVLRRRVTTSPMPKGLQGVCKLLLGHDVDKSEQTSHWGQRPLSDKQKQYAATDAHVLLPLLVAALRAVDTDADASEQNFADLLPSATPVELEFAIQKVAAELERWERPVSVHSSSTFALDAQQREPLGRVGVQSALGALGLGAKLTMREDDKRLPLSALHCKTIALIAHESQLLLCVLAMDNSLDSDPGPDQDDSTASRSDVRRLQLSLCAAALGLRRADVRMLGSDELVAVVGYPRGAVGPIGARVSATILVDEELMAPGQARTLMCGAGEVGWVLPLLAGELASLPGAVVAAIHA